MKYAMICFVLFASHLVHAHLSQCEATYASGFAHYAKGSAAGRTPIFQEFNDTGYHLITVVPNGEEYSVTVTDKQDGSEQISRFRKMGSGWFAIFEAKNHPDAVPGTFFSTDKRVFLFFSCQEV